MIAVLAPSDGPTDAGKDPPAADAPDGVPCSNVERLPQRPDMGAEPIYFGPEDRRLFGWLHRAPAGGRASMGLVVCKPFGYEALCSHRSVREFAAAAALTGVPALRFDYSGTGDSADGEEHLEQLDLWRKDILGAIGELRRRTGVERVCLLGFRLGALLAVLAAHDSEAVEGLILVAPVTSGSRYLRELRTLQWTTAPAPEPDTDRSPSDLGQALEVIGFTLSAASVAALALLDIRDVGIPTTVSSTLVIDRNDVPGADSWAHGLSGSERPLEYLALPGFVEMMMTPPLFAIAPRAMIEAMQQWLARRLRSSEESRVSQAPAVTPATVCRGSTALAAMLKLSHSPGSVSVTERPVRLGSAPALFGILTAPEHGVRGQGVILLNTGADHHIGPSRMYVQLARQWASRGCLVLRLDLAGIGDSDSRAGHPDGEVYTSAALNDVRAALDFIRACGACHVTLAGLCSGAYYALRAAAAGFPVNRILMVNPQTYFWREGRALTQLQLAEVVRNPHLYRERVLSPKAWRKLLTGHVNVWRIAKIYLQRPLLAVESWVRNASRRLHVRLPRDLGWELEDIVARGVGVSFVFARDEPGIDLLRLQGGSSVARLGDRCHVRLIAGGDHIFSRSGPRDAMMQVLGEELFGNGSPAGDT